jgi:hypothetical protein
MRNDNYKSPPWLRQRCWWNADITTAIGPFNGMGTEPIVQPRGEPCMFGVAVNDVTLQDVSV